MRAPASSKIIRALIIPVSAVVGGFATPALLTRSPDELRRAGQIVDGTGYASAGIFGLFGGALVGYVVQTLLDRTVRPSARDRR